jgi:hypothetical protein
VYILSVINFRWGLIARMGGSVVNFRAAAHHELQRQIGLRLLPVPGADFQDAAVLSTAILFGK